MPKCLSSCHRLRSARRRACSPRRSKGAVELNDMIVFLVQGREREARDFDPGRLAGPRDRRRRHHHRSADTGTGLRPLARRLPATLLPLMAAAAFGASLRARGGAAISAITAAGGRATAARAPAAVVDYLDSLGDERFDLRAACAQWAGTFSKRHQRPRTSRSARRAVPRAAHRFSRRRQQPAATRRLAQATRARPRHRTYPQFRRRDFFATSVSAERLHCDHQFAAGRICGARLRRPGLPDHFAWSSRPAVGSSLQLLATRGAHHIPQ